MTTGLQQYSSLGLAHSSSSAIVPATFANAGDSASRRYVEFFTAEIRNPNTREAYGRAVRQFDQWCQSLELPLHQLSPMHVAAYVEQISQVLSKPTVKQHLAAIRMLLDYLVTGQVIPQNPAASVRGPKYVVKKGKTPILSAAETSQLLASIETDTASGLRDRAIIATMAYSFARVSAVLSMNAEDYYQQGKKCWLRLHEKGGKYHEVPVHHQLMDHLDAYLAVASPSAKQPLFRRLTRQRELSADRLDRREALAMIKRRCLAAGLGTRIGNHTFRATGITVYLENGGTIEKAQQIAAHESPRTTKLYDRTSDEITLAEIERIRF
jgi:integrase/recombinase XerD